MIRNMIGTTIKEKRNDLGYTQESLAEEIGRTPSYIGQIERGEVSPSVETLATITQLLAIDANLYFCDNYDKDFEKKELYLMIEQLSPKMRKIAQETIKTIYKYGK